MCSVLNNIWVNRFQKWTTSTHPAPAFCNTFALRSSTNVDQFHCKGATRRVIIQIQNERELKHAVRFLYHRNYQLQTSRRRFDVIILQTFFYYTVINFSFLAFSPWRLQRNVFLYIFASVYKLAYKGVESPFPEVEGEEVEEEMRYTMYKCSRIIDSEVPWRSETKQFGYGVHST